MKILMLTAAIAASSFAVANAGGHYVSGYTRSNGTYVAPHYQSNPDAYQSNNYSTRGNVNPYTGQMGTRIPTVPIQATAIAVRPAMAFSR